MTAILECDCGDCRTCRRAMGIIPTPSETVQLSESTLRLLAGLDDDTPPAPKVRVKRPPVVRGPRPERVPNGMCGNGLHKMEGDNIHYGKRGNGRVTRECRACNRARQRRLRSAQPRAVEKPTPVPCVECGGMIGAKVAGYSGWALAEENGRCEVCADRPKAEQTLAEYALMDAAGQRKHKTRAKRARRMLERVLKDGRAFHPDAEHGTAYAYNEWRCRCAQCSGVKCANNKAARDARRSEVAS